MPQYRPPIPRSFLSRNTFVSVFPGQTKEAPIIYIHAGQSEGAEILKLLRSNPYCPDFALVCLDIQNWEKELPPYAAPAAFKNGTDFGDNGPAHLLDLVTHTFQLAELGLSPAWRGLAGYSLAGLFALSALWQTDAFSRIACMSGSLWYPDFWEYASQTPPAVTPDAVYFSLGDKEERTKNPLLRTVRERTENFYRFFDSQDVRTVFELREGNHFTEVSERIARGLFWILMQ